MRAELIRGKRMGIIGVPPCVGCGGRGFEEPDGAKGDFSGNASNAIMGLPDRELPPAR